MGKIRFLAAALLVVSCLAGAGGKALAGEEEIAWEVFGGGEGTSRGEHSQYLAAGLIKPWGEKYRLLGRLTAQNVAYKFHLDNETLKGNLFSVIPYLGIRRYITEGSVSFFAGPAWDKVSQETLDGPKDKEQKSGFSVQAEMDKWWREANNISLIINYKTIDSFFWGRLRGKKGVGETGEGDLYLGAELVGMGNSNFAGYQMGAIAEGMGIIPRLNLCLKAGFKHSSSFSNSVYGGLEFYYTF